MNRSILTRPKIKFIKSLQVKKYRIEEQCFLVEGEKSVMELLASDFETLLIVSSPTFLEKNEFLLSQENGELMEATEKEITNISSLESNSSVVAVARMKPNRLLSDPKNGMHLLLDDIRDPGNLGTILRTADWFGVRSIVASEETADFYNPKVIRATMGSFCRTPVYYTSLTDFLKSHAGIITYGAFLDGQDIQEVSFQEGGAIIIGNESNGISANLSDAITHRVTIPRLGMAESLNASVATGIILYHVALNK